MMFTQYKLTTTEVSAAAVQAAQVLRKERPGEEPGPFAAGIIGRRLLARPLAYLEFGPYWWAVKRALLQLGFDFGPQAEPGLIFDYGEELPPYSALVAGEIFRSTYLASFLVGTNEFTLDDEGAQVYVLSDADMEARARGLDIDRTDDGGDGAPILDSASVTLRFKGQLAGVAGSYPFSVEIDVGVELWRVDVYAASEEDAAEKVQGWSKSGRLERAIEMAATVGGPYVDSDDMDQPLYIDVPAKRIAEIDRV